MKIRPPPQETTQAVKQTTAPDQTPHESPAAPSANWDSAFAAPSSPGSTGSDAAWLRLALACLPAAEDGLHALEAKWRLLHAPGPAQTPPDGDWRTWLFMGGRGAGKTWAGARWVSDQVLRGQARRIALVGPTYRDVRDVMIGGPSGLIAQQPDRMRPRYEASRRRVAWPNGAEAFAFSAEDPDGLRGPQFDAAWCDEIGVWAYAEATWDTLAFAMRLGARPRIVATTTPRATQLVKRLARMAEAGRQGVAITRAASDANAHNLAPGFLEHLDECFFGSQLMRQERMGELIEDPPDALWTRPVIDAARMRTGDAPQMDRIVVAIDPPATASHGADACGIVAVGKAGREFFVLADASRAGLRPSEWAARSLAIAASVGAAEIVAEANQGGEMVRDVLNHAGASEASGVRVTLVHATASKQMRAQPVSALYDQGRVKHAGAFPELEDQMCIFGTRDARTSPDRVDALVWAIITLNGGQARPRISTL